MKLWGYPRAVWAWSFYDWANSAFILSVASAFFPAFFKGYWGSGLSSTQSTVALGYGNAIAGLVVAVSSPILGAFADVGRAKKAFLTFCMLLGSLSTAGLVFAGKGVWIPALSLFVLGRVGFSLANLFYDSLITDVARPEQADMVSSLGYSIGYLGCGLMFAGNIVMYRNPSWFGLASATEAVRVVFLLVAAWWIVFTIPLWLYVHQRKPGSRRGIGEIVRRGFADVPATARSIAACPDALLFLIAYWCYIDGVHTVYLMAIDFGLSLGLPFGVLMVALLLVQFVAFVFALASGALAGRIGGKKTILAAIGVYVVVVSGGAWILRTAAHFIFFACLTGVAQGAIQALSRSFFAKLIPEDRSAEYFGFYNLVGKFAVVLGPAVVASANLLGTRVGLDGRQASRFGISTLVVLFLAGGFLLYRVNPSPIPARPD